MGWVFRPGCAYWRSERTIANASRARRFFLLAVPFVLAAVHMAVFDRGLGGDGWATFAFLESAVEDRDLFLENNSHGVTNGLLNGPEGHLVMQYPPGAVLLDLVPFLAARAADAMLPQRWLASGAVVPPAGRVPRRIVLEVVAIVAARNLEVLAGLAAILVALRRAGFSDGVASASAALALFGGPLLFYALVGATHAPTFALASLLLLVLVREGEDGRGRRALAAGLLVGAATLVRYSAAAMLPVAVLGTSARNPWRHLAATIAGFAMPLALLPAYWRVHYGQWAPLGYGGALRPTLASPWNVLFSSHHGLVVFHPALALAVAGLVAGAVAWPDAGHRRLCLLAGVWFLSVAVVHGWWSEWANPGGYGQRFLIDALPALAVGFAGILTVRRGRAVLAAALAGTVLFGYLLFFTAVTGLARSAEGLPWPQTLADYRPLAQRPPSLGEVGRGLLHASFSLRLVTGAPPGSR